MKKHLWLPLCLVLVCIPILGWAEGHISVESEGYGVSRQDALLAAKREALAKGIATLFVSDAERKKFALQRERVLSKTLDAVDSYGIVAERQEGTTFFVKIRAQIVEVDIRRNLGALKILLETMDKPRLMVLVKEEQEKAVDRALSAFFTGKGFAVVDPSAGTSLTTKDAVLLKAALGGDALAAAHLGGDYGADYVLVAKVKKGVMDSQLLEDAGMISAQASINTRLINTATGAIISSKRATAGAAHVSGENAQELAARKVALTVVDQVLCEQIMVSFQDMADNGKAVRIPPGMAMTFRPKRQ